MTSFEFPCITYMRWCIMLSSRKSRKRVDAHEGNAKYEEPIPS